MKTQIEEIAATLMTTYAPFANALTEVKSIMDDYQADTKKNELDAIESALCRLLSITQDLNLVLTGYRIGAGNGYLPAELVKPIQDVDTLHHQGLNYVKTRRQQIIDLQRQAEQARRDAMENERQRLIQLQADQERYERETICLKARLGLS